MELHSMTGMKVEPCIGGWFVQWHDGAGTKTVSFEGPEAKEQAAEYAAACLGVGRTERKKERRALEREVHDNLVGAAESALDSAALLDRTVRDRLGAALTSAGYLDSHRRGD